MMTRNPGLKSRFTEYFDFCDWTPEKCAAFVMQNLTVNLKVLSSLAAAVCFPFPPAHIPVLSCEVPVCECKVSCQPCECKLSCVSIVQRTADCDGDVMLWFQWRAAVPVHGGGSCGCGAVPATRFPAADTPARVGEHPRCGAHAEGARVCTRAPSRQ